VDFDIFFMYVLIQPPKMSSMFTCICCLVALVIKIWLPLQVWMVSLGLLIIGYIMVFRLAPSKTWMYFVQAKTAMIRKTAMSTTLEIPLEDVIQVVEYADRPFREVDKLDINTLLQEWTDLFAKDPPNAVVTADGKRSFVCELASVTVVAVLTDTTQKTIRFTVNNLPDWVTPEINGWSNPTLCIDSTRRALRARVRGIGMRHLDGSWDNAPR
jgi:hypothetical protein